MKKTIDLKKELLPTNVFLVGAHHNDKFIDYSMNELENLAISSNYTVVGSIIQNLNTVNPAHYIGKGKMEEIKLQVEELAAKKIIFNDELSGIQLKNLEEFFKIKVMDRTFLILEIFANRASTRESKLQVEVALLKYELPRIRGSYTKFERQRGGGLANKGKGEGLISLDKKRAEEKIATLEKELIKINRLQKLKYKKNKENQTLEIVLVGYTNAGKSTLMNKLANLNESQEVFAKDLLFATLDTTSRKIDLIPNLNSVISDTVGFVDKLPTELIKAFQSTLSVVTEADIIINLIDAKSPFLEEQKKTTIKTLERLEVDNSKIIEVYNKCDTEDFENEFSVSARNGRNIDNLKKKIENKILESYEFKKEVIKYENYFEIIKLRKNNNVIKLIENKRENDIEVTYYLKKNLKSTGENDCIDEI